jgi:hypothetical protein
MKLLFSFVLYFVLQQEALSSGSASFSKIFGDSMKINGGISIASQLDTFFLVYMNKILQAVINLPYILKPALLVKKQEDLFFLNLIFTTVQDLRKA